MEEAGEPCKLLFSTVAISIQAFQEVEMSVEATIEAYLLLPLEENRCLRFLFCNYNAPLTSSHQVLVDV